MSPVRASVWALTIVFGFVVPYRTADADWRQSCGLDMCAPPIVQAALSTTQFIPQKATSHSANLEEAYAAPPPPDPHRYARAGKASPR